MFTLNGKEIKVGVSIRDIPRLEKYLDKMSFGQLLTSQELLESLGYKQLSGTTRVYLAKHLKDNCCLYMNKWVWGSKKTIKEFRKQIEQRY